MSDEMHKILLELKKMNSALQQVLESLVDEVYSKEDEPEGKPLNGKKVDFLE